MNVREEPQQPIRVQPKVTKMSPSEQKIFQDIAKSIEDLAKLMKESNSNDAKTINPNNKNTVGSKIAESIDKLALGMESNAKASADLAKALDIKLGKVVDEIRHMSKSVADGLFELGEVKKTTAKK